MKRKKIRYGCPNPECTSFRHRKKYRDDLLVCPDCGTDLSHVCKSKGCYTAIEDPAEPLCLTCRAKLEDKKDKGRKAVIGGGLGIGAVAPVIVKNRETIKEMAKAAISLIKR